MVVWFGYLVGICIGVFGYDFVGMGCWVDLYWLVWYYVF